MVRLVRELGGGPFREIGTPVVFAEVGSDVVVVAGYLGVLDWRARIVRLEREARLVPVGVFDRESLTCRYLLMVSYPVRCIAVHPTLPLVAVGGGAYDGGYCFDGELLLLDVSTGRSVSLLDRSRRIEALRWVSECDLEIVMSPFSDAGYDWESPIAERAVISRDTWWDVRPGAVCVNELDVVRVPGLPEPDGEEAAAAVEALCEARGMQWEVRGHCWAVEVLPDGYLMSTGDGVVAEFWPDDEDAVDGCLPVEGVGCQIVLSPDGRTGLVCVDPPMESVWDGDEAEVPSRLRQVLVEDGDEAEPLTLRSAVVVCSRSDGWLALRDVLPRPEGIESADTNDRVAWRTTLVSPEHTFCGPIDTGPYDPINHYFDIRHAPDLLLLADDGEPSSITRWVCAIDPPSSSSGAALRRLFLLDWTPGGDRLVQGGPGAFIVGEQGHSVLHGGRVFEPAAQAEHYFVVRRRYPDGALEWVTGLDADPVGIDILADRCVAVLANGEAVVLDLADGWVLSTSRLSSGSGHPVIPLCVAAVGGHRLGGGLADGERIVIGTLDGRILECDLTMHPVVT